MYREIAVITPQGVHRNQFLKETELEQYRGNAYTHISLEVYEEDPDGFKAVGIPHFVLDLDHDTFSNKLDSVTTRLRDDGIPYAVFQSGPEGYHVWIPNVWDFTPDEWTIIRLFLSDQFPEADSQRFMSRALIRMPYSINDKYDTEVKLLYTYGSCDASHVIPSFSDFEIRNKPQLHRVEAVRSEQRFLDMHLWPPCIRSLWMEGPVRGRRHTVILRLLPWIKRQMRRILPETYAKEATLSVIRQWLAPEPFTESEFAALSRIYDGNYEYGCHDPVLRERCERSCFMFNSWLSPEEALIEYAKSDIANRVDISPVIGLDHPFYLYPGDYIAVNGFEGSFKSAFVQWLLVQLGEPAIYFSWDMTTALTMRRFLQIKYSQSAEDIIQAIQNDTLDLSLDPIVVTDSELRALSIQQDMERVTRALSLNPKIVVYDHIGMIEDNLNSFQLMTVRVKNSVRYARNTKTIVIGIDHVTRADKRSGQTGMGRNAISEAEAATVLLITKGDEISDGIYPINIKCVKARDNRPFDKTLIVSSETFTFREDANV